MSETNPERELVPLAEPSSGLPSPVDTPEALAEAVGKLNSGSGPVAIDAERASGFRYGQRAYLFQFNRSGAGNILIDPIACRDLTAVQAAIGQAEWVLHAASQDLPCLAECGLRPEGRLFDTELAARLLGYEHVSLGAVVADTLGISLAKAHSADDWSRRPLPDDWLAYAALDVDLLLDVREALSAQLAEQGKVEIASQEFEAERLAGPPAARLDPWRKVSGGQAVATRRGKAMLKELWQTRDNLAQQLDRSPGRVLSDSAIVAAVLADPPNAAALGSLAGFAKGYGHYRLNLWWRAISRARRLPVSDLPELRAPRHPGPPPAHAWAERDPQAAARLAFAKPCVAEISQDWHIPVENLLKPAVLRQALWEMPDDVPSFLSEHGARAWQIDLISPVIEQAFLVEAMEDN